MNDVHGTRPGTGRYLQFLLWTGLASSLAVAGMAYMYFSLFTKFAVHDDEGWMMIALQHFLDGGVMYDAILNVYGPFYYLVYWLIYGLFGVPLTTDAVRFVTMGYWVGSVVFSCVCVWFLTRQASMVVVTFVGVLFHLTAIRNEPVHPQELCALLFAGFAAAASSARHGRAMVPLAICGSIACSLIFTKINVGVLAALALLLTFLFAFDHGKMLRIARWGVAAIAVLLPVLLLRASLHDSSTVRLAGVMVLSVICLLISQKNMSNERVPRQWWILILAFMLPGLISCAFVCSKGTTLYGLWDGLVLRALKFTGQFLIPLNFGHNAWHLIWVAPLGFLAITRVIGTDRPRLQNAETLLIIGLKALFGLIVFACTIQAQRLDRWLAGDGFLIFYCTPFLGLVLLPPHAVSTQSTLSRLAVCWFTLLEVLIVYPVAGTQSATGTFLFLPIAAICLGDTIASLESRLLREPLILRIQPLAIPVLFTAVLAFLLLQVRHAERRYAEFVSLNLPGARLLHLDEHQVAVDRWLAANLTRSSDTFLCNIGLNSLYFWTGKPTPSVVTLSTLVHLFPESVQQELMTTLQGHERGFFLYHDLLFQKLARYDRSAPEPLMIREMRKNYVDRGAVDGFHLMTLETQPPPELVDCGRWIDPRLFSVTIAPRPGLKLGRLSVYDLDEMQELAESSFLSIETQGHEVQTMTPDGFASPIDLSVVQVLSVGFAEAQSTTGHRFLIRLYDERSRQFGSLPFLEEPGPSPELDCTSPQSAGP